MYTANCKNPVLKNIKGTLVYLQHKNGTEIKP